MNYLLLISLLGQQPEPKIIGLSICKNCHSAGSKTFSQSLDYVRMNEYSVVKLLDKHSLSYAALHSERSKLIGKNLNIDPLDPKQSCLKCHGLNYLPENQRGDSFNIMDGVANCDNCHGKSSNYLGLHSQRSWREKTPEEKAKLGFREMRDPVIKSQTCAGCHIGEIESGRILTHQDYSAGHPPMNYELTMYLNRLPPHWLEKEQLDYWKNKPIDKLHKQKLFLTGQQVQFQRTMELLGQKTNNWTEQFQSFGNCFSCHRSLLANSTNSFSIQLSDRTINYTPGRPILPSFPIIALDRLKYDYDKDNYQQFSGLINDLYREFNDVPFGRQENITKLIKLLNINQTIGELSPEQINYYIERLSKFNVVNYDQARFVVNSLHVMGDKRIEPLQEQFQTTPVDYQLGAIKNLLETKSKNKLNITRQDVIEGKLDLAVLVSLQSLVSDAEISQLFLEPKFLQSMDLRNDSYQRFNLQRFKKEMEKIYK